jgi:hypothetical protein
MIPRTFPSTYASNGQQQMVVHFLTSVAGLARWSDYIPVKLVQGGPENSYSGTIDVAVIPSLTANTQAWKEYIPVYVDNSATDAWTVNNIGYIPYNYALFNDAAMQLDLTNGAALDPRITFSRATNATVTGSNGLIQYAPMNLIPFSEQFDNASWFKSQAGAGSIPVVTANTSAAPDGTMTADTVVFVASASGDQSILNRLPATSSGTYTGSFYVRATSAGDVGKIIGFRHVTSGAYTLITLTSSWQRATATETRFTDNFEINLRPAVGTSSGTVSVQIWGAQLEVGSTATTYNPTTVKNLLGFTEHFDNAAWTKSNSFVQTNLLLQSEAFDNAAWPKENATVTANTTAAPDGSVTADTSTEAATTAVHTTNQAITVSAVSHTFSVYLKKGNGATAPDWMQLSFGGTSIAHANFNLSTGTVGASSFGTPSITFVGNGWYRCSVTVTPTAGSMTTQIVFTNNADSGRRPSYAGQITSNVFIWGAQLVQGTTPGDYKATYAAAAAVGYTDIYGQPFAQKLVEDTSTGNHIVSNVNSPVTASAIYTYSCYAKAGERTQLRLLLANNFSPNPNAFFNLSDGTVISSANTTSAPTITAVGNGWYRCSISGTASTTGNGSAFIYPAVSGASSYTGDGTSGIYIFGAQLSDSASVDPYVYQPVAAPASTAYYGPRFDYDPVTLAPKGLLIEEQRTQLLLNSSLAGTSLATQNVTVTAVAHTLSFYGTGTVTLSGTSTAGPLVGTGAYPDRSTLTFTPTAGTLTLTVTGTVQFAQLEIGAFATSFIPSAASQVTRAADSASMIGNNFARWYTQGPGTLYGEALTTAPAVGGSNRFIVMVDNGTPQNSISLLTGIISTGTSGLYVNANNVDQAYILTGTRLISTGQKLSGAYQVNSFQAANSGALGTQDTSGILPVVDRLRFGSYPTGAASNFLNGTISRIAYFNRRLADSELIGITS